MELKLKNKDIKYVNKILDTEIAQEESAEIIVPDTMPDILRIVDSDAVVTMRSKTPDVGRVTVSGNISASVLYCPEGASGLRRLNIDIPFVSAASDGRISTATQVIASVKLCFADAAVVNSRKAVVRVSIITSLKCCNESVIKAGTEFEQPDKIETLVKSQCVEIPVCIKEKSTALSDEHSFDSAQDASVEILKYNVDTRTDEYKVVGNKLVIRARAYYSLLCRINGSDIKKHEYTKEFSQIIELEDVDDNDSFEIFLMPASVYFECSEASQIQETKIISEIHVLAQCIQKKKISIDYIADAYSTCADLSCETEKYRLCVQNNQTVINELLIKTIEIPDEIKNIVLMTSRCSGANVSPEGTLRTTVYVSVIYTASDDRIMSTNRRFEVEAAPESNAINDISVSAVVSETYSAVGSDGIDLRISVDFQVKTCIFADIESVIGGTCEETDGVQAGKNSLVLRRLNSGESLWQLAKQYRSRIDTIMLVNGLEQEQAEVGSVLLIPKVR